MTTPGQHQGYCGALDVRPGGSVTGKQPVLAKDLAVAGVYLDEDTN